jgi:hypothetical protein
MGALQKWFQKATPQRMMKPFPLPPPTEGGPQKVVAILDTVTDPEFINSLQTNCRVEIQGTPFEISFEFSPDRTLIIAPDRLSEDHFRGFMGTILTAGFTGAEIENLVNTAITEAVHNMKERADMTDFEYARDRIKQKKWLFIHFIVLLIGSLFLFTSNHLLNFHDETNWWIWVVSVWICIFIFHLIKVLITDSFMNKNWERAQIDKLMLQQNKKIEKLKNDLENSKPTAE